MAQIFEQLDAKLYDFAALSVTRYLPAPHLLTRLHDCSQDLVIRNIRLEVNRACVVCGS